MPLTLLIDRAINPTKTVEGLLEIKVDKLEIIEDGKVIETVEFKEKNRRKCLKCLGFPSRHTSASHNI